MNRLEIIKLQNGYNSNYCAFCYKRINLFRNIFNIKFEAYTWDNNGFKFTFCSDKCRDKMEKIIKKTLMYAKAGIQ